MPPSKKLHVELSAWVSPSLHSRVLNWRRQIKWPLENSSLLQKWDHSEITFPELFFILDALNQESPEEPKERNCFPQTWSTLGPRQEGIEICWPFGDSCKSQWQKSKAFNLSFPSREFVFVVQVRRRRGWWRGQTTGTTGRTEPTAVETATRTTRT